MKIMKNVMATLFGLVFITLLSSNSFAQETLNQEDNFSFGVGLGVSSDAESYRMNIATPTLFAVPEGKFFAGNYKIYAGLGLLNYSNLKIVAGEYENSASPYANVGLQVQKNYQNLRFGSYARIGAVGVFPDSDISDESNLLGVQLASGVEIPLVSGSHFFMGFDARFINERADKLAGKPDLFNQLIIETGVNAYLK